MAHHKTKRERSGWDDDGEMEEKAIKARRDANLAELKATVAADEAARALRHAAIMAARATAAEAELFFRRRNYDDGGGFSPTSSPSDGIIIDEET